MEFENFHSDIYYFLVKKTMIKRRIKMGISNDSNLQFDIKSIQETADTVSKLLLIDSKSYVKPDKVSQKWFGLSGLRDTPEVKLMRKIFTDAYYLIDEAFMAAFAEGQIDSNEEIVGCAILNILARMERIIHRNPTEDILSIESQEHLWRFKVMVFTILRYEHALIKIVQDPETLAEFPTYWRQYGFCKTSLIEALLYYKGTERALKEHRQIYFHYIDSNTGKLTSFPILRDPAYLTMPYCPVTYADEMYMTVDDLPRNPYTYYLIGEYEDATNTAIYDYRDASKLTSECYIPTDSPKRIVLIPKNKEGYIVPHGIRSYVVEPGVEFFPDEKVLKLYIKDKDELELPIPYLDQLAKGEEDYRTLRIHHKIYLVGRICDSRCFSTDNAYGVVNLRDPDDSDFKDCPESLLNVKKCPGEDVIGIPYTTGKIPVDKNQFSHVFG